MLLCYRLHQFVRQRRGMAVLTKFACRIKDRIVMLIWFQLFLFALMQKVIQIKIIT